MTDNKCDQNLPVTEGKSCKIFFILGILVTLLCIWNLYAYQVISQSAKQIEHNDLPLTEALVKLEYFDDALTMTAKLAASNGDYKLFGRYKWFANDLDRSLIEIGRVTHEAKLTIARSIIEKANEELVAFELRAFELIKKGDKLQAQELLSSATYDQLKVKYKKSVKDIRKALLKRLNQNHQQLSSHSQQHIVTIVGLYVLIAGFWIVILKRSGLLKKLISGLSLD